MRHNIKYCSWDTRTCTFTHTHAQIKKNRNILKLGKKFSKLGKLQVTYMAHFYFMPYPNFLIPTVCVCVCVCARTRARTCCHFSRVQLFATPWTVACLAPLSTGFSRQEYWSGLLRPLPGDLPDPGIECMSLKSSTLAGGFFTTEPLGESHPNHRSH